MFARPDAFLLLVEADESAQDFSSAATPKPLRGVSPLDGAARLLQIEARGGP
jgi:hypothetical protein